MRSVKYLLIFWPLLRPLLICGLIGEAKTHPRGTNCRMRTDFSNGPIPSESFSNILVNIVMNPLRASSNAAPILRRAFASFLSIPSQSQLFHPNSLAYCHIKYVKEVHLRRLFNKSMKQNTCRSKLNIVEEIKKSTSRSEK